MVQCSPTTVSCFAQMQRVRCALVILTMLTVGCAIIWMHASGEELDDRTFADRLWDNNTQVGVIFNSWLRWMQNQGWPEGAPAAFSE